MIALDQPLPDFSLPATGGHTFHLQDARGNPLVLYFYPKDLTPGCTIEAGNFRDLYEEFLKVPCPVVGISRDSLLSHQRFIDNMKIPFPLLSDSDEEVCNLFGVIKDKNMYGKKVRGIERSTFLIDKEGILRHVWRGVKIPGHATEVLQAAKKLK